MLEHPHSKVGWHLLDAWISALLSWTVAHVSSCYIKAWIITFDQSQCCLIINNPLALSYVYQEHVCTPNVHVLEMGMYYKCVHDLVALQIWRLGNVEPGACARFHEHVHAHVFFLLLWSSCNGFGDHICFGPPHAYDEKTLQPCFVINFPQMGIVATSLLRD